MRILAKETVSLPAKKFTSRKKFLPDARMIPLKSLTGGGKKNQGSRASLVIHNNSRVSSLRLITLGVSCCARGRSVFELVRLSSQADENELAEDT